MSTDTTAPSAAGADGDTFDLDARWELAPTVSVRPERFGALLYDFSTRRLSFLKARSLLEVLEQLPHSASARAALAVVPEAARDAHARALRSLADTGTIRRCDAVPGGVA